MPIAIDKPSKYFDTKLYTGTGATQSITGLNFKPDLVWIKDRTVGFDHVLQDAVRGTTKIINSNQNYAEFTNANSITSFNSDGFTTGSYVATNNNTTPFVSWNWLASNTTASNTSGTITSTVSANTTSGFSIVSYTGNGNASATFGHGLGATPKLVIIKNRPDAQSWQVWFNNNIRLGLNSTASNYGNFPISTSSTLITTPSTVDDGWNGNTKTYIAYCFAEVKGYSKFGSYIGNGSADGVFVYTGFTPAWVLWKNTSTSGTNWVLMDNKRNTYNPENLSIAPNTSDAEADFSSFPNDFLSNGFKLRNTGAGVNASGSTYIYMAFASNPFVSSKGIPTTAR